MARKATGTTKTTKASSAKTKTTRSKTAKPKTAAAANPSVKMAKPAAKAKPTPVAKPKPTAKAKPTPAPAKPATPATPEPAAQVIDAPIVRKPDLIERIAARTDIKRRDIKAVMELVLDELGQSLERGEDVVAQPMGRIRVNRKTDQGNSTVYVAKIRRSKSAAGQTSQSDDETGVEPAAKAD